MTIAVDGGTFMLVVEPAGTRVFRVTVKGRFADLSDRTRRYLVDAAPEHTRFQSAYTAEGTFVYDPDVKFFNLRYEVRVDGEDASEEAAANLACTEAETFLQTMEIGHGELDVSVVDLSTMWSS